MDRQRVFDSAPRLEAALRRAARALGSRQAFRWGVHFLAGFGLAFSAMGSGMAPFGLAYAAMCPQSALAAAAGAFAGYTLAYGAGGLVYAAAVLICFACKVAFKGTRLGATAYLMPLCAFASLMCVKSVVAVQSGLLGVVLLLCEAVLCAGFCLLFDATVREGEGGRPAPLVQAGAVWGRLAILVAVLLIFQPIRVLGDIAPARVAAVFAVMLVAWLGGSALGAGAGVALGASMDLAAGVGMSAGMGPFFAAAYGFAGLIGGLGGRQGRFVCAVCHVLANCVATMWGYGHANAIPGLFECFVASVFFVMLPDSAFNRMEALFGGGLQGVSRLAAQGESRPAGQRAFAMGRIQAIGAAIGELGATMDSLVQGMKRQGGDVTRVYDRAAERVCRRCPTASLCWDRDYQTTHNALNDVTATLRQKNCLREGDFPPHFAGRCVHLGQLCGAINEEYRAFLRRLAETRREAESRSLMGRQYRSLQGVLTDMAGSVGSYPEYFPTLEARVRAIAKAYCRPGRVSVYALGGRLHVEVTLPEGDTAISDPEALIQSLGLALKRQLWPPESIPGRSGIILRISERERLSATVGCAVRRKQGEAVCGDTSAHLHTDDGRAIVLLSDGMGTGSSAGELSSKAIELISGFVRSGCSLYESAKAVMPVLAARFEQCGFVTLDLLEINLFTGHASLLKYGAAPSYVLRGGRAEQVRGQALPAGLSGPAEAPRPITFKLGPGDRVLMMSDGVWDNSDTGGLLEGQAERSPGELGSSLIEAAAKAGAVDDMSVLVVSISGNAGHA